MGIFDRLGDLLRSYINDEESSGSSQGHYYKSGDPDIDAAYEELDGFLKGDSRSENNARSDQSASGTRSHIQKIPEELRGDFAELGLPFGADKESCKEAYKKLLKLHHPDRHAGHAGNMKKATEKSARINAAYDRIEKWRKNNN